MSRRVRNRQTGREYGVPAWHWSLKSDRYEEVAVEPGARPLPASFPSADLLRAVGCESIEDVEALIARGELEDVPGIGHARAVAVARAIGGDA